MKTLVLQSCREPVPEWLQACMQSVREWSEPRGYQYLFSGDEIFDCVPDWYLQKVGDRKQIATDFARLVLSAGALEQQDFEQVIWFDADVLVLDRAMALEFDGTCAFGQESWIQPDSKGRLVSRKNVHNAVCVFRSGCPVLPFLVHAVESLMRRVDPAHIVPQFVGPKLLNALHPLADFALLPQVGALSEVVVEDIHEGGGQALELLRTSSPVPLQAVNVCASLLTDSRATRVIEALLEKPGMLRQEDR